MERMVGWTHDAVKELLIRRGYMVEYTMEDKGGKMTKWALLAALWAGPAGLAQAGPVDGFLRDAWQSLRSDSQLHVLDNLSPGSFYDLKEGRWFGGAATAVWTYKALSLDGGIAKPLDADQPALPLAGFNLHLGYFLPRVLRLTDTSPKLREGLLKNLTVGVFGTRDFYRGLWRYGLFTGLEVKYQ